MFDRSCAYVHIVEPDSAITQRWDTLCQAVGLRAVRDASHEAFLRESQPQDTECPVAELHLPNDLGQAFLKQMLARHWTIPIVATSFSSDPELIVHAMQLGAIDYFPHSLD